MVSGIEDLIKYRKSESNSEIVNLLAPKINEYLKQAEGMKSEINS